MSRLPPLLVAALVLIGGFAPAVTAAPATDATTDALDDPAVESPTTDALDPESDTRTTAPNNTTTRLQLTGPRTGNYSDVTLDFGGTMAMSAERVEGQYHVSLVSVQLERVNDREARTAVVNAYLDAAVEELDELETTEATAVERYRTGEITAEALLVRLSIVDMRARAVEDSLTDIEQASGPLPRPTLNRIEDVRLELNRFTSPIRRHVAMAAAGELKGDVNPLYVTASPNGVVVEMLNDRRYLRNTIRFDNRNPDAVDQLNGLENFQNRIEEVYTWSYPRRNNLNIDVYTARNLYAANYLHPQGSLLTFIDGGTTDVFREEQSLLLGRLPVAESVTRVRNNTTVRIERTPANGPFKLNVTQTFTNASGNTTVEPANALVKVDGRVVGRTGTDGELWMLAPVGEYEVTVVHNETTINASVAV